MFLFHKSHPRRFAYHPSLFNYQPPLLIIDARLMYLPDVYVLYDFNDLRLYLLRGQHNVVGHDIFEYFHRIESIEQGLQMCKVFCF